MGIEKKRKKKKKKKKKKKRKERKKLTDGHSVRQRVKGFQHLPGKGTEWGQGNPEAPRQLGIIRGCLDGGGPWYTLDLKGLENSLAKLKKKMRVPNAPYTFRSLGETSLPQTGKSS